MALSLFTGRRALVTGASRGIGRAVALHLAQSGMQVVAVARSSDALVELSTAASDLPGAITPLPCDLSDVRELTATLASVSEIAVIVNCAGWATPRTPAHRIAESDWHRTLSVCLHAPMQIVRHLLPEMIAAGRPAAIVQILSPAARRGRAGEAAYAAAKSGLRGFTEALRDELRGSPIAVTSIFPGYVDTAFLPENRRIDRSLLLQADDVAHAVIQVLDTAPHCCVEEVVVEPQSSPFAR